jgi:hypothetical protein
MNKKNELPKNETGPALLEVETAELQAIIGGQVGGHGHSEALLLAGLPLPTPWRAAAFPLPTPWRAGV